MHIFKLIHKAYVYTGHNVTLNQSR